MMSSNRNIFRFTGPLWGESPHKDQWRRALMFSLICAWTSVWVNDRDTGDFRRNRAHYDVTVMFGCPMTFPVDSQKSTNGVPLIRYDKEILFRITGILWGQSIGDCWFSKTWSVMSIGRYVCCWYEQPVEQTIVVQGIWDTMTEMWRHKNPCFEIFQICNGKRQLDAEETLWTKYIKNTRKCSFSYIKYPLCKRSHNSFRQ